MLRQSERDKLEAVAREEGILHTKNIFFMGAEALDRIRSESPGKRIYCDVCKGTYWSGAICPHLRARFAPSERDAEGWDEFDRWFGNVGHCFDEDQDPAHEIAAQACLAALRGEGGAG